MLPRLLITWLTNCIGLLIAAAVIGPISYGGKFGTLLLAGLVLGIINFLVRPLVILLTLPAVILSLGIALLFINALMLWLTSKLVSGFHIGGFWSTVGGALILWIVNMALRPWTSQPWRRHGHSDDDGAHGDGQRWQVWVGRWPGR
jgi:putative membrane protein